MKNHYRNLFTYGSKFRRDDEFVKDCLQDVFLGLWKNRETLGSTNYVKSYLFKCVRNKIYRELHKNRWHLQTMQLDENYYFDVEFSIEHHLIRDNPEGEITGVFNTRSPSRPNPIGMHVVKVLEIVNGSTLRVYPLEVLDSTPVVDIKPVLKALRP